MTQLTTVDMRLDAARTLVANLVTTPHYVFVGNNLDPAANSVSYDSPSWTLVEPYRDMIMGKVVGPQDATLMIIDVPWVEGTTYSMYDDQDPLLSTSNYYSSVVEGDFTHFWKCLDNDNGSPSTAQPSVGDVGAFDEVYQTSDGYRWKYMYSADSSTVSKFSTQGWTPLIPNTSVTSSAQDGVVDIVKVDSPGAGYDNNLSGAFRPQDLRVGGNSVVYSIAANSIVVGSNGFYTGCVMYLSYGAGAGQYRRVVDFYSNAASKYVVLESGFDEQPTNGTGWEVTPEVIIAGTGLEAQNAYARALVNAVGNSIYRVEVLSRGLGYTWATAAVTANAAVSPTPASVRVISPPRGGHGSDPASELRATSVGVSVTMSGSEGNTIPYVGDFGQVGLLRDPVWVGVDMDVNAVGTFLTDDAVTFYTRRLLQPNCATNSLSQVVTSSWGGFDEQLSPDDWVYVSSADGTNWTFSQAEAVNSTTITLTDNVGFACTSSFVYGVSPGVTGTTTATGGVQNVTCTLNGPFGNNALFFTSTGSAVVTGTRRGGVEKGFDTFVQAVKLTGTYISGSFQLNELAWAGPSTSSPVSEGVVQSVYTDGSTITVYLTRAWGEFFNIQALKGQTSGAYFQVQTMTVGELKPESGPILHLENLDRVTRSSTQREDFRLLFSF